jgi:hypothetical protein
MMDRRTFIGAFAGGLVVARSIADAQPAARVYRIGVSPLKSPGSDLDWPNFLEQAHRRIARTATASASYPRTIDPITNHEQEASQ